MYPSLEFSLVCQRSKPVVYTEVPNGFGALWTPIERDNMRFSALAGGNLACLRRVNEHQRGGGAHHLIWVWLIYPSAQQYQSSLLISGVCSLAPWCCLRQTAVTSGHHGPGGIRVSTTCLLYHKKNSKLTTQCQCF